MQGQKLYGQYTHIYGTRDDWDKYNPIPDAGQLCIAYDLSADNKKINPGLKAGDGETDWEHLPWISGSVSQDIIDRIEDLENEIQYVGYSVSIESSGGTVLSSQTPSTTMTATLLKGSEEVTDPDLTSDKYVWTIDGDSTFSHVGKTLSVQYSDFSGARNYRCTVSYPSGRETVGIISLSSLEGTVSVAGYLDLVDAGKMQYLNADGIYSPSYSEQNPLTIRPFLYESGNSENIIGNADVTWYYKLSSGAFQEVTITTQGFQFDGKDLQMTQNLMTSTDRTLSIQCRTVYEKNSVSYTTDLFIDLFLTVQDSSQTATSYNVILSNENHTIACDVNGLPKSGEIGSNGRATTTVNAFLGSEALTPVATLAELGEGKFYCEATNIPSGIQFVKKSNLKEFFLDGNIDIDAGSITISVYCETQSVQITKVFSFLKARDSVNGQSAKLLQIVGEQFFTYDGSGAVSPDKITLTTIKQNVTETPRWFAKTSAGTWQDLNLTVNSVNVTPEKIETILASDYWINDMLSLRAEISADCYDEYTLYSLYDGVNSVLLVLDTPNGSVFKNDLEYNLSVKATLYSGNTDISEQTSFTFETSSNGSTWTPKTPESDGVTVIINKDEVFGMIRVRCTCTYQGEIYQQSVSLSDLSDPNQVILSSPGGVIFKNNIGQTTLTATVLRSGTVRPSSDFSYIWKKIDKDGAETTLPNQTNSVTVYASDIDERCTYTVSVLENGSQIGFQEISLTDLSDVVTSATAPTNPIDGMLWMDTSQSPPVLKVWRNGKWEETSNSAIGDLQQQFTEFEYKYEQDAGQIQEWITQTDTTLIGLDEAITEIENQKMYRVSVESSNGTVFKNGVIGTTLSCSVYSWDEDVTSQFPDAAFIWKRASADASGDTTWNNAHSSGSRTLQITSADVVEKAVFSCTVDLSLRVES